MHINLVYKVGARRKGAIGRLVLAFLAALVLFAPPADSVAYGQTADEPCKSLEVRAGAAQGAPLRVTFMGVSTLLFDDGETAVMTDGFFSRPDLKTLMLGKLKPDQKRIDDALFRAGVKKLAAVLTAHSHHDHAMDAPEVARRTGALLVGSKSTRNNGRGVNFPEDRFRIIDGGETLTFGRLRITVIKSRHSFPDQFMGEIKNPLRPPARIWKYREGGSYSYMVEHDGCRILIHPSANYRPGFLRGVPADVIFLGIGGLGNRRGGFAKRYWREVVQATGAKVIIPIHWDDFTRPLDKPLRPMPRPLDNGSVAKNILATINSSAEKVLPQYPV